MKHVWKCLTLQSFYAFASRQILVTLYLIIALGSFDETDL